MLKPFMFSAIYPNPTLAQYNAASEPKVNYHLGQDRYLVTGEHVQILHTLDEQATRAIELWQKRFIWPWGKGRRLLNEMVIRAKQAVQELLNYGT